MGLENPPQSGDGFPEGNLEEDEVLPVGNHERNQKIERREGKPKFFHASRERYRVGDVIAPYVAKDKFGAEWGREPAVYLSDVPAPHYTLTNERPDVGDYTIYQVVPLSKPKYGLMHKEIMATGGVKVVKVVGSAGGFVARGESSAAKVRRRPHPLRLARDAEGSRSRGEDDLDLSRQNSPQSRLAERFRSAEKKDREERGGKLLKKIEAEHGPSSINISRRDSPKAGS